MVKNNMPKQTNLGEPRGTNEEQKVFTDVQSHYTMAKEDLEQRVNRKNGFDDADKMFASHIDESGWPYKSMMFDARPWTVILEKSARLIGSKPKGRLVPREDGDALGAVINNELLNFQWEDNSRLGESMISKWIMMDQNARKYGASFALTKWNYACKAKRKDGQNKKEVIFDGPDFVVCNPRDVLANPSYTTIKSWFQYREYVTMSELINTNDAARKTPVYKNLDILRDAMREEAKAKGDTRASETLVKNKSIRGLRDFLGEDEVFKTIEVVTEYRPDRWITFVPRHGVVIRDIPNPYEHGEIPVVMLKYYPLPDDLYGVSELEPVSKMIRGINSLFSQYIDNIAVDLYPPLMVNPVNVRMHTLEFTPEAKWLMNNPGVDVQRLQTSTAATNNFQAAYSLMVSSLLNALGETSQGISNINPNEPDKTATEVRDSAFTRNVRDNMNQIFLSESLKKQIMFWHSMNQQLLFKAKGEETKIIRIVGRDAQEFFERQGLGDVRPTDEDAMMIASGQMAQEDIMPGPRFAVMRGGMEMPKYQPDISGNGGQLVIEEGDLLGHYDYVPDIESMQAPSNEQVEQKLTAILGTVTNPAILQLLAQEQRKPKIEEILIKLYESTRVIKDADAYFEDIPQQPMMPGMPGQPTDVQSNQVNAGGGASPTAGVPNQGAGVPTGMAGGI